MRTRALVALSVILTIAVCLLTGSVRAQEAEASEGQGSATEFYGPPISPGVYLVNFLILYMVNPGDAAKMPAYKAPIPKAVANCLEQNPNGLPICCFRALV